MHKTGATISVSWGNDVEVSIRLTPRNWASIKAGKTLQIRGKGYKHEGEFFWDHWDFSGGLYGSLVVTYGEEGGVGFDGLLADAVIKEHTPNI